MSTSPIQATTVIQDLAKAITRRYDADGDGRLSSDEFSGFLSSFLGSMNSNPLASAAGAGLPTGTAAAAVTPAADRARVGTMAGFDSTKLADTSHTTPKYRIGRILQYYPNTPAGLKSALPELQQLVPGLSIIGSKGDKLDFGAYISPEGIKVGVVDVIQSAGSGGTAWQWAPDAS
jgi:hypothetical protein